ncbi:MAG: HD domain-containing phosphohydrolase [Parcubacteria group bacterium]|jgi:HD-GYP domain-containing protein (c-di-GMP phosphodiesterase class II)
MNIEIMGQNLDKSKLHVEEEQNFDNLVKKNCYNQACEIIDKDEFIRQSLMEIKEHDMKTFLHSLEVGNMTAFIVNQLGDKLTEEEKRVLMTSALLHDYGKTSVDAGILNKEGELTQEERLKIEKHPEASFVALKNWDIEVAKVAVAHHEHQSHSYPRKNFLDDVLEKRADDKQVRKLSRMLAIMDSFQSMLDPARPSNRGKIKSIDEIVAELNDKKFILNEDKEIIFLLEEYYYKRQSGAKMQQAN